MTEQIGLGPIWPQTSKDRFSHDGAHILQEESKKVFYSEDAGPKYVGYIENAIDTFGSNGYAASDSVSINN